MHRQKTVICDADQLFVAGFGLHPLRRDVEEVDRAVDIVDVALGKQSHALCHPRLDLGDVDL